MCPMCMTSAALIAASGASGAGVLGLIALKFRALRSRTFKGTATALSRKEDRMIEDRIASK